MTNDKNELFITEITEEDFRKLSLTAYSQKKVTTIAEFGRHISQLKWVPCNLNDILDNLIQSSLENGYHEDLQTLSEPVTVAIHKENGENPQDYYLDKFLNILGPATYLLGTGIKHLYSTRDYFESKDDYWRVPKRETKAVYRIYLDKKWLNQFVLKHLRVASPWPYVDKYPLPEGAEYQELVVAYDFDIATGEWIEKGRSRKIVFPDSLHVISIDKEGNEIVK